MHHPDAPKDFWVVDLRPTGDVRSCERYTYNLLERIPGATELIGTFSTHLYRDPDAFETRLGIPPSLNLRFSATAPSAGIATLRRVTDDALVSLSLLVCGTNRDADQITLQALQKHMVRELRDTPHEPSFALMAIKERPLIATVSFADPPDDVARHIAALSDRCFAASFFRYHQLA